MVDGYPDFQEICPRGDKSDACPDERVFGWSLETDEVAELFIDCRDRAYVGPRCRRDLGGRRRRKARCQVWRFGVFFGPPLGIACCTGYPVERWRRSSGGIPQPGSR